MNPKHHSETFNDLRQLVASELARERVQRRWLRRFSLLFAVLAVVLIGWLSQTLRR